MMPGKTLLTDTHARAHAHTRARARARTHKYTHKQLHWKMQVVHSEGINVYVT